MDVDITKMVVYIDWITNFLNCLFAKILKYLGITTTQASETTTVAETTTVSAE